ncbi:MAG TPA: T9SS type A sorting domain-containing protein [Bacteroidia bacterium]|nr:T9SS type A sorting domain-containing protein [Bacteroidia bacterium]
MKNKIYPVILLFVLILFATSNLTAQQQVFPLPSVNGTVYCIAEDSSRVYVGGDFTEAGVGVNGNVMCDTSAQANIIFDSLTIGLSGIISSVIPDGIGGFFIGGNFISASGKKNLIHVDINKIEYPNFNPSPEGYSYYEIVSALHLINDTLYVGGDFYKVANNTINYLAALNASTGLAYNFMPLVDGAVKDLKQVGDTLYFGGQFSHINNTSQVGIGAIKISTGQLIPMPVSVAGNVYKIFYNPSDNRIYMCGNIIGIGANKSSITEFNAQTSAINNNFPKFEGLKYLFTSTPDGVGGWYIGGMFMLNNGIKNLMHILNNDMLDTAFHPNPNKTVRALSKLNNILFVGGEFDSIGGIARKGIASINANSGIVNNWNAKCDGTVNAILAKDSLLYVCGFFYYITDKRLPGFAILNINNFKIYSDYTFVGSINSITADTNAVFVAGNFNSYGKSILNFAKVTTTNVTIDKNMALLQRDYFFEDIYNSIFSAASDGIGGWYLCGNISTKQGLKNLVHINANNTLDTVFNPNPDNTVYDLHIKGNTIYVAGNFTNVDGQSQPYLAAVNKTNGSLINSFTPQINSNVKCIEVVNNDLYLGGDFTTINTVQRSRLASINIGTGILSTWNPNVDKSVYCLTIKDSVIFVGGTFKFVGTQYRNFCASIYLSNGLPTPWNANINSQYYVVYDINITGNKIYVGGTFDKVNGLNRKNLAAYDLASGNLINGFNAKLDGQSVNTITSVGNKIFIGGNFTTAFSQPRKNAACFNTSNILQNWDPSFGNYNSNILVYKIAAQGNNLLVVGYIKIANVIQKNSVAKINLITNEIEPWSITFNLNYGIKCMTLNGQNLYIGGQFDSCNSQARKNAAAVNINTGLLQPWNPNVYSYRVDALMSKNNTIFIGGVFNKVGGKIKGGLAAVDNNLGLLTSNQLSTNGSVYTLSSFSNDVLACGEFSVSNVLETGSICAFNHNNWTVPKWDPKLQDGGEVYEMFLAGNLIYACGNYTSIGGQTRHGLGAINVNTGNATPWNPNPDSTVFSIAKYGTKIFACGVFQKMNGVPQKYTAALKVSNGSIDPWQVEPNRSIKKLRVLGNKIWLSNYGSFMLIKTQKRNGLFSYSKSNGIIDSTFHPAFSGFLQSNSSTAIRAIMIHNDSIFIGGNFQYVDGMQRNGLVALQKTNGNLLPFQASFNNSVKCIKYYKDKLYVGGLFNKLNGVYQFGLCTFNYNTGALLPFNPMSWGSIFDILVADSTLYVGGQIYDAGGIPRKNLAAFDINTNALRAWNPAANYLVRTILNDGNNIFIGGDFTTIGGNVRNHIASVDKNLGALNSWNFSLNSSCNSIIRKGNELFVAGDFNVVNGDTIGPIFSVNSFTGKIGDYKPKIQHWQNGNSFSNFISVNAISFADYTDAQLKIGGSFNLVNNKQSGGLTSFSYFAPPSPNEKINLNSNSKNITQNILSCYPNPANEKLYVTTLSNNPFTVSVKNISGAELIHKNINGGNLVYELDITSLNSGIYFITYTDGKVKSQSKFVKQ